MRLTKGQLKRIIREEYTRLKRRGLLREAGEVDDDQDTFLLEQLADYSDELISAAMETASIGMDQMEDDDDPGTPEAAATNACTFHGQDNMGPDTPIRLLSKCSLFKAVLDRMAQEQQSMFGMKAPLHQVIDAMVDTGLADEIIIHVQHEVTG